MVDSITATQFNDIMREEITVTCSEPIKEKLKHIQVLEDHSLTESYGKLVLTLASGQLGNPVDDPVLQGHVKAFLENLGFDFTPPIKLRILQRDVNEFVMLLPPKEIAEAAICVAKEVDSTKKPHKFSYKVPDPYGQKYNDQWKPPAKTELKFLQYIIGDYTMRYCR